jgi:hypothetical protein
VKTIDLKEAGPSIEEIPQGARAGPVVLEAVTYELYLLSPTDDLATEVELLRANQEILSYLDECKASPSAVFLEEVETRLREPQLPSRNGMDR